MVMSRAPRELAGYLDFCVAGVEEVFAVAVAGVLELWLASFSSTFSLSYLLHNSGYLAQYCWILLNSSLARDAVLSEAPLNSFSATLR